MSSNELSIETSKREFFAGKGINGLMNKGNTCYINTSIQCLGHCTNFLHYILSGKYERNDGNIINELRELFMELWIHDNGVIPNRFLKYLRMNMNNIMDIFEQNDIQEFLTMFIDKLNASISQRIDPEIALNQIRYMDTHYDKLKKKLDKSWYQSMCREYSPLLDYFYGQSVNQIICGSCKKIHHNYEPFSILILPISHTQEGLIDCLKHYSTSEYLNDTTNEDSNEWKCDGCNKCEKSLKTMKFWRLPKVLTICFKRFTHDLRKNNVLINIPEEIDLTDFVIGETIVKYELCSIACHMGSFNNGHYYAICRNPNNNWFRLDDTNITKLDGEFQTPSNAYMVFYQEKSN
jgi:ubiquitin C-terminal hydrolase